MHAIRVHSTGGPDVLMWEELPSPSPGPGEIRVEPAAVGLNFIDTYHRTGIYPMEMPFTPGMEGAGLVTAVGDGVDGFAEGDRVAWTDVLGSYAQEVVLPAARVVPVPDEVELETAAAAMLQGLTAHYLATSTFSLEPNHRCLIHAGAGGVGQLLIQIAKRRGAEVFTTVSTDKKAVLARAAGADHVFGYTDPSFVEAIKELAGDNPLDVVYDGVGASTVDGGLELLKPRGLMVLFGQSSGVVPPFDLGRLARLGSLYITRPTLFHYVATRDELLRRADELFGWIASGDVTVTIGHRWPLADAAEAHRALQGRRTTGKVLLIP